MRRIIVVFLLIILCFCFTSCQKTYQTPAGVKTYQKPMDVIYIYTMKLLDNDIQNTK
ncbi:hypothetical protein SAMN02745136_00758 [Anaerocolumna jejuensis DSM 15929]|uniref:Uncharacterized protein n=1 Tax=Anaerocolumna jejuensis DSM 15929 TaxID=1121322 RepID=A0A1M6LXV6_9FIRM|nr:hypothetical protein SAMN02745136_00758 [Anaerocolumna jejuensis DSM 15929]